MSTHPMAAQSKSWWSRSKSPKDVPPPRPHPSAHSPAPELRAFPTMKHSKSRENMASSKLNTFVNAIGKRTKKPTLTIQDPPPSIMTTPSIRSAASSYGHSTPSTAATSPEYSQTPFFTNRPPAKSVSSTVRSYEFDERSDPHTISEPRTPSDHPRDRRSYQNSVLTLSDPDPFAAGSVILPRFMQDPNRLSVYSDSSMLDPHGVKRMDPMQSNRMSYGSSSSNSHSSPFEAYSPRMQPSSELPRRISDATSGEKRNRRETFILTDSPPDEDFGADVPPALSERPEQLQSGSVSSCSTLAPRKRMVSSAAAFRTTNQQTPEDIPSVRPRGMTVAGEKNRRPTVDTTFAMSGSLATAPLRLHRKASEQFMHSQSPSSTTTSSPIMFSASSSVSNGSTTPQMSASSSRPLVLVRKASSSRVNLPPLNIAPPSLHLPPPPLSPLPLSDDVESVESLVFPDPPSAGSSSMSFASLDEFPTADEIHHFMRDAEAPAPVLFSSPAAIDTFDLAITQGRPSEDEPGPSEVNRGSPQVLRRVASQQAMTGRRASEASFVSVNSSFDDHTSQSSHASTKGPRKQRSFHRIPIPQLSSLRHSNSHGNSSTHGEPDVPRSPTSVFGSPQPRRRLFSGSSYRRGSLSKGSSSPPPTTTDDDLRSMFSLSLDGGDSASREPITQVQQRQRPVMMSFSNMGNQLSLVTENACIAPSWHEMMTSAPPATKRLSTSDYTPQRIMSPADMLKLEEQLADEDRERDPARQQLDIDPGEFGLAYMSGGEQQATRSRTNSILSSMSAATTTFGHGKDGGEDDAAFGKRPFGSPSRRPSTATEQFRATTAAAGDAARSPTARQRSTTTSSRPSTAQPALASPTSPTHTHEHPPSPKHHSVVLALPPPPRPRPARGHVREDSELSVAASSKRASVVPLHPLSPPPRRKSTRGTAFVQLDEFAGSASSEAPPASHPPSAFNQKAMNRRSVMKKPSFLEIDDDEPELDFDDTITLADIGRGRTLVADPMDMEESSFLDLDRGSFDTIRSFDDEGSFHAF